jgi:hypothetical protein
MALDTNEVQKALDAGATIIADSNADRARPYNVGERELADYLAKNGYEEKGQGVWKPADDTKFSREKQGTGTSSAAAQAGVHNYVNKVTGRDAAVNAAASMLYAGSYLKGGKDAAGVDYRPAINVSVHALDPLSTAYHESLHWFADHLRQHGDPAVFAALTKAADSAYVRNFLRTKFRDQPDALKQVDGSAEERIAYMYQFHKNGELKLGDRGKTILDHIAGFFERVFGVWSNDARALHIMDYFGSGKYADAMVGPDVKGNAAIAHKAMMEVGRNKALDRLHARVKPLREVADALGSIGSARIRDYGIPALTKIVDLTRLHDTKEGVDPGYLPAAGVERRARSMALVKALGKFTMEQADAAFERIALGHKDGTDTHQTGLMDAMRQTMFNMHGYMKGAGVDIGERGLNTNYTPRVWNPTKVAARQDAFRTMIQKYIDSGQFKGTADDLMSRLMRDDGSELPTPRPGDQHVKERSLHFITAEDAQPFLETDALRILTSYIAQGTRRAEWARRFEGKNADGVTKLDELRTAAVEQGATPDQMKVLDNYLLGVTGRLGADISPGTRKLFGQLQVYQNLRVLPLGFFSMLIDPGGVKVRGGSWGDAFNNLKRGLLEIPRGFQKVENRKSDAGYQFAEDLGVIDAAVLQHVLGAAYGLGGLGDTARTVNEAVFKWNLMDQMNTSQRVGATEAAMRFLLRHKDGDASEHSMRYLSELGIKPADIELARQGTGQGAKRIGAPQKDGFERIQRGERIAVTEQDFLDLGYNAKQALAAHLRMRQAVNRWVDGAVLRPDQSSKAIWMNDPLFALVAHMKQFAFSFQDTVIKRVMHEARHGNYAPATALASYIPMMLAADFAKGLVQGGGSQPSWKKDWDLTDWMVNSTQRAGLFGQNQFGIDAFKDIRRGGTGIGALGGPSVSQLTGVISAVGGRRSMHSTIIDALPANALWSGYMGKTGGSAGRSDGHRGGETTGFEPHEVDRGDP